MEFTTTLLGHFTRRIQFLHPSGYVPGIAKLTRFAKRHLPQVDADVILPNGVRMQLNTRSSVPRTIFFFGTFQPAVVHLFRKRLSKGMYCLDVGANHGYFALDFAQHIGPTGKVAALEANPELVAYIRTMATRNRFAHLEVVADIIHEKSGMEMNFYVTKGTGGSSVDPTRVSEKDSQSIRSTTLSIDDFIATHAWPRLDVIKMDIEGADCYGLLGASESIARFRPFIIFEFNWDTPSEVIERTKKMLAEYSYSLTVVYANGSLGPFTWKKPADSDLNHVDVVCTPD